MEADNVTDVAPTEDFDFTMKVRDVQLGRGVVGLERERTGRPQISCTDCRAEHSNPVSINVKVKLQPSSESINVSLKACLSHPGRGGDIWISWESVFCLAVYRVQGG
jgi:hypothetical protein